MTAAQKTVSDVMDIGVSGQVADLHTDEFGKTESLINTAPVSLGFGILVRRSTSTGEARQYADNTDTIAGVTMFERVYDYPSERDDVGPLPGLPIEVLRKGNILVYTQTAVTMETGEVHVWTGAEDRSVDPPVLKGQFRGTASSGNSVKLDLKAARWKTTLGAAGIAELEVDFPPGTLSTPTADT
jgi:hypothetical protein